MPIRINLLAEHQAAEEARRRDPVKRAAWIGGTLVTVMVAWAAMLQVRLSGAKGELARVQGELQAVQNASKQILANHALGLEIESRLEKLQKYSTNRFFLSTALDAVQRTLVPNVRVVKLQSHHSFSTNAEYRFKTNSFLPRPAAKKWWSWGAPEPSTNYTAFVEDQLEAITNRLEFVTNRVALLPPRVEFATNQSTVDVRIEVVRPAAMTEQVTLTIKARDYGNPPGRQVEEFLRAIGQLDYFRRNLHQAEGQGIWLKERAIQPKVDPDDRLDPSVAFIPFTVECRYQAMARSNEQ